MIVLNLKRFKSYLIIERGVGDICTQSYLDTIKRFFKATGVKDPTKEQVIDYMMDFHDAGYSYTYTTNTMLALEHYMSFMGYPMIMKRPRRPDRRVEDWLTEQEMARIFAYCKNIREKTIIALLAYTGIRNRELCKLRVKDIDFEAQTIFIKAGKGLKDGVVCVAPSALNIIAKYLSKYNRTPDQTILFSIEGSRINQHMRPSAIRKHVKIISKRAGITRRIYPHMFRHSLAMNMLLRGGDIYSVKEQLRHSYLSTTEKYVKSHPQIMKNNYQIFAPNYIWGNAEFSAKPNFIFTGSNNYKFNN
jgi:integrase/recombinase XerD